MADPSAEEFASWLRPRGALSMLGVQRDAASEKQIVTRILDSRIRIAGHRLSQTGGKPDAGTKPTLVGGDYLVGPWIIEWDEFWSSGQMSFVRRPIALQGFAVRTIIGVPEFSGQPEVHSFCEVRLDPIAMGHEFDLDLLPAAALPQRKASPERDGGRPGGKHGEPIARITKLMGEKSGDELRSYTAAALGVEVIDEYFKLGLDPPSEANAVRIAAGILKAIKK